MALQRFVSVERLEQIAREALLGGYGTMETWSPSDPSDPLAGRPRRFLRLQGPDCDDPIPFELYSRYSASIARRPRPLTVAGTARCRKCVKCRKARMFQWRQKAVAEFNYWPTTVFGTFTMSPDQHYMLDARIEAGLRHADGQWLRHPVRLKELSSDELFSKRVTVFGEELQRYFKRLRKGDAERKRPKVRYLLVAEAHDSALTALEMRDRVHFHVLIHEVERGSLFKGSPIDALVSGSSGDFIRKKHQSRGVWRDGVFLMDECFVRKNWSFGWTKFQYAENERAASYLCKYLTKTASERIRASQFYGSPERIAAILHTPRE